VYSPRDEISIIYKMIKFYLLKSLGHWSHKLLCYTCLSPKIS